MGTKEKKRKGGDLYTKQCAGSAADVPTLSRTPAQGAPPNHTQPPYPGYSTGPSSAQLLCKRPSLPHLGAHTLHPKTTVGLVPGAGR